MNISILGATGYIGGNVFLRLVDRKSYNITVLVRTAEKARQLEDLSLDGVRVVHGSATDATAVQTCIQDADVIIDMFNSNDLEGNCILLDSCKRRFDSTGVPPFLIHISGGSVIKDNAMGRFASDKVWDDINSEDMANAPASNPHRGVDLEVLKADAEGYIKSYIVMPCVVFGTVDNILSREGLQQENNIVTRLIIEAALTVGGEAASVGGGYNRLPFIHVDDMADLILTVFDNLKTEPHGSTAYYFGESFDVEHRWVVRTAARSLQGDGTTLTERALTQDELELCFKGRYYDLIPILGGNSRCKGTHARMLGWKAKYGVDDLERDITRMTAMLAEV